MKLGYQAVYDSNFFDAIDYASNNGFDFVSFDLNVPKFYIDNLTKEELWEIKAFAEKKRVGLAFHAPGDNISLFSDYPCIRDGILKHFAKIIKAAELLNASHVTVHPGSYPALRKARAKEDDFSKEYSDYFSKVLYDNLFYLAQVSKSVKVCVENFNFTAITMNVLEELFNDTALFLTWDIAKTYDRYVNCNEIVEDFMLRHKDKVEEIHVHDMIKDKKSHETVGSGDLDFFRYAEVFKEGNKYITIEVRPREEAKISRDRLIEVLER